jgi:hypothetical protein
MDAATAAIFAVAAGSTLQFSVSWLEFGRLSRSNFGCQQDGALSVERVLCWKRGDAGPSEHESDLEKAIHLCISRWTCPGRPSEPERPAGLDPAIRPSRTRQLAPAPQGIGCLVSLAQPDADCRSRLFVTSAWDSDQQ